MPDESVELIYKYFPKLTAEQREQFAMLYQLYEDWNAKINVISRKDLPHLYEHHVLHSLGIAKIIEFKKETRILDVGTGGGFPGIPLAILFPDAKFTLVDSIGKKIKVVQAVSEGLGLKNVRAYHQRVEEVDGKFHFIISRAVADFNEFYRWVKTKFAPDSFNDLPNGIIALKGGDLKEELSFYINKTKIYDLDKFFEESYFETKRVVYLSMK